MLDCLKIPGESVYVPLADSEAAWAVIRSMQVSCAPGCLRLPYLSALEICCRGQCIGERRRQQQRGLKSLQRHLTTIATTCARSAGRR